MVHHNEPKIISPKFSTQNRAKIKDDLEKPENLKEKRLFEKSACEIGVKMIFDTMGTMPDVGVNTIYRSVKCQNMLAALIQKYIMDRARVEEDIKKAEEKGFVMKLINVDNDELNQFVDVKDL